MESVADTLDNVTRGLAKAVRMHSGAFYAYLLVVVMAAYVSFPSDFRTGKEWSAFPRNFADHRSLWLIPNFLNVTSNIVFLIVGFWGLRFLLFPGYEWEWSRAFVHSQERVLFILMYGCVFLSGVVFALYGYHPTPASYCWTRIILGCCESCYLSVLISERISARFGSLMLAPLLMASFATSFYALSMNSLEPYFVTQMFFAVSTAILMLSRDSKYTEQFRMWAAVGWFIMMKVCEILDFGIFSVTMGLVSGLTLAILSGALAAHSVLRCLSKRVSVESVAASGILFPSRAKFVDVQDMAAPRPAATLVPTAALRLASRNIRSQ
eukprot:ANDGO_07585.mRNA.1 hypothetical protein